MVSATLSQLISFGPASLVGRSQHLCNFVELVDFAATRKQWQLHIELSHDATQCEDVYWRVVVGGAEQQLRGSIPPGGDVLGKGRPRANLASEPEVTNFDNVVVNEQILRLHISMEEAVAVHVRQPAGHLVDDVAELGRPYRISCSVNRLLFSLLLA